MKKTPSSNNSQAFTAEPIKISMWKMTFNPLKMLINNWQKLLLFVVLTALLLALCSILFKRNIICSTGLIASLNENLCGNNLSAFGLDLIVRTIILMLFAIKWYQSAFLKQPMTLHNFFRFSCGDIKACGIMIVFILINLSPIIAFILLAIRQVTPNWHIELLYFTSVAWIFLLPIIALRFYNLIGFALEKKTIPTLKTVWIRSSGNMLKFLLGAAVIVFLALFIFMQYYAAINAIADFSFINAAIAEFEYDLLVALFSAYWLSYCYVQKNLLFEGEKHE